MFFRIAQVAISFALLATGPLSAHDSPVLTYWTAVKSAAINDLVSAFNQIGSHAGQLRAVMSPSDAAAFDAVMRDVMGALMALPAISYAQPRDQDTFVANPRPDRIGQLVPDLTGMERFFSRLSQASETPAKRRIFQRAQTDVTKILAALPAALPTLDARSSSRQEGKKAVRNRASSRQTVVVYLNWDASSLLLGPGKLVASSILQKIGVWLDWRTGEAPSSKAAIAIRTTRHAPESAGGEALAASRLSGAAGVEIMIYEDRLHRFLNAHPSLVSVGVGYVMAHELAHAMQGEARHSESGIMKAHWDTRDFQEMLFQKLAFTAEDVDSIHRRLAAQPLATFR